jgi:hypothetical protein
MVLNITNEKPLMTHRPRTIPFHQALQRMSSSSVKFLSLAVFSRTQTTAMDSTHPQHDQF